MTDSTNKFSLIYTNLNASKESYSFDGKKDVGNYFLVPGYGTICSGVSLCTIGQRMSLAVYCDQVSMEKPQDLCNIFERKNLEALKTLEWEKVIWQLNQESNKNAFRVIKQLDDSIPLLDELLK